MKPTKLCRKGLRFLFVVSLSVLLLIGNSYPTPLIAQNHLNSEHSGSQSIVAQGNAQKEAAQNPKQFPVTLDGQTLFTIQVGGRTTSAAQRAELATEEITQIAKDYLISLDDLELKDFEEVIIIAVKDDIVLGITNDDAEAVNQPLDQLANQYLQAIKEGITNYRKVRTTENLVRNLLLGLLLTVVFVGLVFFLFKLTALVRHRFEAWRRRVRPLRIQRLEVLSIDTEIKIINRLVNFIRLIILLVIFYGYLSLMFRIFPQTQIIGEKFRSPLYNAFTWAGKGFVNFFPNLFIIVLTIIITFYLIRFCGLFFAAIEREIITIPGFETDWAKPTNKIVNLLLIAGALAVILPYLPIYESPAFQGISLLIGALITFGGASTVANLVGGVVIIYTRAYRLGDLIKTEDYTGIVHEKTILSTRLRTLTGEIITIPNASLISTSIVNYNAIQRELNTPLMVRTSITLGYDVPWRKVHQVLREAAQVTEKILDEPSPYVLQMSLDDFYISYELRAYTDSLEKRAFIYSELHQNIQDKCNEAGIEIMSPHYSAIRDGHQNTIPETYLPSDYIVPGFRIDPNIQK